MNTSSRQKIWYRENIEHVKRYNQEYRIGNPVKYLLRKAANNAQQSGKEFDITEEDLVIPSVCPVLGIPIEYGGHNDNVPSIDRFDNSKGYVKGNVNVISWRANRLKGCASKEDLKKILSWMENNGQG